MNSVGTLVAAKALIADPKYHCKGLYSIDQRGNAVVPWEDGAVCFCAFGAISRIIYFEQERGEHMHSSVILGQAALELFGETATFVNDEMQHSDLMRVFDHAIEIAKRDTENESC